MGCGNSQPNKQIIVDSDACSGSGNYGHNQSKQQKLDQATEDSYQVCVVRIQSIISTIDLLVKVPQLLQTFRTKLVHLQGLLGTYDQKKFQKSGINQDFFDSLSMKLTGIKVYISDQVRTTKGQISKEKADEYTKAIDPAIEELLKANIKGDKKDNFLQELKQKYKGKPGYKVWKQLFKNKVQMSKDIFIQIYAVHNDVGADKITVIADFIDADKNNVISFEEFMTYISNYKGYYDTSGAVIKNLDTLMQRLAVETQNRQKKQQVNNRKIEYQDELVYEGDISNGLRHGKGKLTQQAEQYSYEGDFCNDAKHGVGTEIKNRSKYEGEWKNNQKCGKGKITYSDGSVYEGEFKNDLCEGIGKLILSNGSSYQGKFQENVMVDGVIIYPNGERYEGQTRDNNIKHGRGKMYDATGKLINEGNFSEDVPTMKFEYKTPEDRAALESRSAEVGTLDMTLENHEQHDVMLLSKMNNLKSITITFSENGNPHDNKELTVKLIQNMSAEAVRNMTELHVSIPNEKQKIIEKKDFSDLFQCFSRFGNLTTFDLQLSCWGTNNLNINHTVIESLVACLHCFKNVKHLHLNLFSWGYLNMNLIHDDVVKLFRGIAFFQSQLITFTLNMGRWGCETYSNYLLYNDKTLQALCDLIKLQTNLEELNLNIRSWPFKNNLMTNEGISNLFIEICSLSKLKKAELIFRGMAFENNITQESVEVFAANLSKLTELETLSLNFLNCDNFTNLEPLYKISKSMIKLENFNIEN